MCLGVPGEVIEIFESDGLRIGTRVDFGGITREVVPRVRAGGRRSATTCSSTSGFAISDDRRGRGARTYALLRELDELGARAAHDADGVTPEASA